MTELEITNPCAICGLGYCPDYPPDVRYHRRVHDAALNGPRTTLPDGIHYVTPNSKITVRKLASRAASEARRETKYDFSAFTEWERDSAYKTTVAIAVANRRVIALLVVRRKPCNFQAELGTFQEDHFGSWRPSVGKEVPVEIRWTVAMIWVLKNVRGTGIAGAITEALTQYLRISSSDLAHELPFTIAALKLWRKLKLVELFVV